MQRALFDPPAPPQLFWFDTVLMDPPWDETGGGGRGAQNHYDISSTRDILHAIVGATWDDGPHEGQLVFAPRKSGAIMFMWATETYLEDALWLVGELGFRKVSGWVWVKTDGSRLETGLGFYGRMCHEHLLVCRRGKVPPVPPEKRLPSVFVAPRPLVPGTKRPWHSRKPSVAYDRVETVGPGPVRVEMFARVPRRKGWLAWGKEADQLAG